jgi:aarF domain-containing kinase
MRSCACLSLRFIFSPEGTFFRSFLLDEVVKSIDALSREQLVLLVSRLGLQVRHKAASLLS